MSAGKVKAAKMTVHTAPQGTAGVDGRFHVHAAVVRVCVTLPRSAHGGCQ